MYIYIYTRLYYIKYIIYIYILNLYPYGHIYIYSMMVTSLARQTPPLFEIGQRGGSLVNRVDFSVPAKEFGPHANSEYRYYYLFYICVKTKIANEQMIHDFTKNVCLL